MDVSLEKYIERLTGILKKKAGLLQEILDLTRAQALVINEDGIDELQRLVDQKQLKIDAIDSLDDEFSVYFNRLKSSQKIAGLDELSASRLDGAVGEAKEFKSLTGEILELITAIREVEKVNSEKSKTLLNQLGDRIKKINQGKKANSAYAPGYLKAPSYFIDKKK